MNLFMQIITNKIFISFFVAMVLTQTIKIIYYKIKKRKFEWRMLVEDGGFPSNHATIVGALTTSVFFEQGISILFMITLIFSSIIIKDAIGVRWEVHKHAVLLKELSKEDINVHEGHTPLQVLIGILIGILISIAVHLIL